MVTWAGSLQRAWQSTWTSWGQPLLLGLVGAGLAFPAEFFLRGPEVAIDAVEGAIIALLGGTAGLVSLFLWNLAWAPYRIERDTRIELEAEVNALRQRVTPNISCAFEPLAEVTGQGNTLTTKGGTAQTLWRMVDHAVKIRCTNTTGVIQRGVRALLIGASRVHEDGSVETLNLDDQIELAWNELGLVDESGVTLLPGGSAAIYVLVVRPGALMMLYRNSVDLNRLPLKYHQMFAGNDRFRLKIGLYAEAGGPRFFEMDVRNGNPAEGGVDLGAVSVSASM